MSSRNEISAAFLCFWFFCPSCGGKDSHGRDSTTEDSMEEADLSDIHDAESEDLFSDGEPDETALIDGDGDGYYSDEDCDDSDDTVFPGVIRECRSPCNIGYSVCQEDGAWTDCTASSDCECDTPGASESALCGLCGHVERWCSSEGEWELLGECEDQGDCAPGTHELDLACGNCGYREARCSDACTWVYETDCLEEGDCAPGALNGSRTGCEHGEISGWICSDECAWEQVQDCDSTCYGDRRTDGFKEEICIPGGPFLYGTSDTYGYFSTEQPMTVVILSPFYIDRYPVTNARYRECVDAGVCDLPTGGDPLITYRDPGYDDYPVFGVAWDDAVTFCYWDGFRGVPLGHMWEKAARGPYPTISMYPWGDDAPTCDDPRVCRSDCGPPVTCPVGSHPTGASYYGVEDMMGPAYEWSFGDVSHIDLGTCMVDPGSTSDTTGPTKYIKGERISYRQGRDRYDDNDVSFRCARLLVPLAEWWEITCEIDLP